MGGRGGGAGEATEAQMGRDVGGSAGGVSGAGGWGRDIDLPKTKCAICDPLCK